MYEYIERNSDKIKKNIKAYFQNARLGLLKYDELNKSQIDEEVDDLFDKVLSLNNNLLKNLIKDLDYDEEDYPIEMLNDRYSKTTKYVFANELERKRARYKENIISSMYGIADFQGRRKDFSKEAMLGALSSIAFIKLQNDTARFVAQQIEECAVDDERYMYLQEGIKEGVEYVRWVSMDDGRDCDECHELNGQIFPIDAVPDKFHWGCRCEMEYVSGEELKALEDTQDENLGFAGSLAMADSLNEIDNEDDEGLKWAKGCNPNFGQDGYIQNCPNCAVAFELRARGTDAVANPLFNDSKLTYEPWLAYTDSSYTPIFSEKHLTDVLSGFKENDRFSIAYNRVSSIPCYGHVISGVIVNGEPHLYDGSIGGYITESLDFSKIYNVNVWKTNRKTLSEYGKEAITINGRLD